MDHDRVLSSDPQNDAPAPHGARRAGFGRSPWVMIALGAVMGAAFCVAVLTPRGLDPRNIDWAMSGKDETQHFLGWMFYRDEPWSLPIGLIHAFGAPLPTSIVYTDSIPIFAVFFKLLRGLLPPIFYYAGLWALCCYLLQGAFGALLARALGADLFEQMLGAAFFVLSPIMLFRVTAGHDSLAAHWTILAALWLSLRPSRAKPWREMAAWALLINLSFWIHPYLWAMTFGLGMARACQGWLIDRSLRMKHVAAMPAAVLCGSAISYWMLGLPAVGAGFGGGGFGESSMNLNAPFNPWGKGTCLHDLSLFSGQGEGFNYLGLGVILLAMVALGRLAARPISRATLRRHAPLAAYCLGLFLFSLSNRVTYGDRVLRVFPLGPLRPFCMAFRSSGRFFWPVYYVIVCAVIRLILTRCSKGWAKALLVAALVVQAMDLSGFLAQTRHQFQMTLPWRSPLRDPAWKVLGERYRKLIVEPVEYKDVEYAGLAFFAVGHRMTINVAYLARYNETGRVAYQNRLIADLARGAFDPGGVYVTRDKGVIATIQKHLRPGERLAWIDGMALYAPGMALAGPLPPTLRSKAEPASARPKKRAAGSP